MNFEVAKTFDYNGEPYITLAKMVENGHEYVFANRLNFIDNSPTDECSVFTKIGNEASLVVDSDLIQRLLPEFREMILEESKSRFSGNLSELFGNGGVINE